MTSQRNRDDLFQSAFAHDNDFKRPTPHLGQSFRFDQTKVAKLSFAEQYTLSEFENTSYRDLPAWIRDGGYAIPSSGERKVQKQLQETTGLNQTERNLVFDKANADAQALAQMVGSDILRGTETLDNEITFYLNRYGDELSEMLGEVSPEAANYVTSRLAVKAAEAKVTKQQEEAPDVAAEIKAAQTAIEMMNNNEA